MLYEAVRERSKVILRRDMRLGLDENGRIYVTDLERINGGNLRQRWHNWTEFSSQVRASTRNQVSIQICQVRVRTKYIKQTDEHTKHKNIVKYGKSMGLSSETNNGQSISRRVRDQGELNSKK